MTFNYHHKYLFICLLAFAYLGFTACKDKANTSNEGQIEEQSTTAQGKTEIREVDGSYQLYRNNKPYEIRGAGIQIAFLDSLAAHGGNSLRTWGTENAKEVLDKAQAKGLTVSMGLWLSPERHHFDYDDEQAVEEQFQRIKKDVLKYKNHPALLNWVIGNELNHGYSNQKVYDAVNDISKMIHEVDPNHLTTTTTSGINKDLVDVIKARASDLDFLSIQVYAAIENLPANIKRSGWDRPYMVTEWGSAPYGLGGSYRTKQHSQSPKLSREIQFQDCSLYESMHWILCVFMGAKTRKDTYLVRYVFRRWYSYTMRGCHALHLEQCMACQ